MMKRKLLALGLAAAMVFSTMSVFAEEPSGAGNVNAGAGNDSGAIVVTVDGQPVEFDSGQQPVMQGERALVPMRPIFEALGAYVDWNQESQTVFANKRFDIVSLAIGSSDLYINGEKAVELDVPAQIMNDRTMVPVRAISEALGAEVKWDGKEQTVTIISKQSVHRIADKYRETGVQSSETGTVVLNGMAAYPVIDNSKDSSYIIDTLNSTFEKRADAYIEEIKKEADAAKEEMKFVTEAGGQFSPYEFQLKFDIPYDKGNLISVVYTDMRFTGGAHPNTGWDSAVYDLVQGKKLELTDVMNGTLEEIQQKIVDRFSAAIDENPDAYIQGAKESLKDSVKNVGWYLDETGIRFYFQVYELAPYVAGTPSITIPYTEKDVFKLADL